MFVDGGNQAKLALDCSAFLIGIFGDMILDPAASVFDPRGNFGALSKLAVIEPQVRARLGI